MAAALLLAETEPETRGFLERHLPDDGFELVPAHGRFDLVLASDVEGVDRWLPRAPVIVLGREEADTVDCIHALQRGCDDYVMRPFEYQELVAPVSGFSRIVISGSNGPFAGNSTALSTGTRACSSVRSRFRRPI